MTGPQWKGNCNSLGKASWPHLANQVYYCVEAQATLRRMHRQELMGMLAEAVCPESKAPSRSLSDLIHPDLVDVS